MGEADDDDYDTVDVSDYLAATGTSTEEPDTEDAIGVIVASGSILDGSQPPGTVGGDSTARTIRGATEDDDVKALVLRVDSPGGSAFASEIILSELQAFRESGRPLVVSMSSVAASGGYWISMGADEIWASPTTITGSIGVAQRFPRSAARWIKSGCMWMAWVPRDCRGRAVPCANSVPTYRQWSSMVSSACMLILSARSPNLETNR